MAKRQTRTSRSVWEDQATEYNPDAPAVVSAMRGEKWKRRALYVVAFGVVPLCMLVTFALISGNTSDEKTADLTEASVVTNSSAGKSAAFAAVQQWLAGDPSPLPGGTIVSWNGYTVEKPPAAEPDSTTKPPTYRFETHTFTVARGEQMFSAAVQVAVGGSASAMATSTPTLTPIVNTDLDGQIVPWFGLDSAAPPKAVDDAVTAWAEAFTSGDPDELRRAVQDKNPDHTFVPLTGVASVASASVVASADVPTGDENIKPTQMIVRVELTVWWVGAEPTDDTQTKKPAPITYDLLIDDADTASPFVVAWGAPGTGPTLKAHGNALNGVQLEKPNDQATPAPTETPADGGE